MKKILPLVLFLLGSLSFSQTDQKAYSDAIRKNIKRYSAISDRAYLVGKTAEAEYLFDTLVNNHLVGTRFNDYQFKRLYGGKLKLSSIKKPILIQTYASWCIINKGEIPALNKLARQHAKDLQIIVVFWDRKQAAKAVAAQFNGYIEVCYANESYSKDTEVVATMKNAIGYLSSYFLNDNLEVLSIRKGAPLQIPKKTPIKEAIRLNFEFYNAQIADILVKSNLKKEHIAHQ
ncbi:redoxin domain-containing protein [Flavobacterium sp.]|uniref:TlpA family protein disulfide reductase n=1 Tax=Flavobacterium sp. TaxID=239 RepID=UPI0026100AD1|nr:redoxin domain-containing protein [Flavobacterium sp.]